jgi:hypothetical protein
MYPINQVILGGDPLLSNMTDLDAQMQAMEAYRKKLQQLKYMQSQTAPSHILWDKIDAEVKPLTEEQRMRMLNDSDYSEVYIKIQEIVQTEILNLVKGKIENSPEGKELLERQLKIVKKLKKRIVEDTNREMEAFKLFKEYSKNNPGATYEEFIKSNI